MQCMEDILQYYVSCSTTTAEVGQPLLLTVKVSVK